MLWRKQVGRAGPGRAGLGLGRLFWVEEVKFEPGLEGGVGGSHPDVWGRIQAEEQRGAWRVPGTAWG